MEPSRPTARASGVSPKSFLAFTFAPEANKSETMEKRHAHDPHSGVTGQLEYDHPVSYEVAVAKKPQMILNSEVMGDEQPVPP